MSLWDARYKSPHYAYGTEANDFLRTSLPTLKPQSQLLSIGEGEGRNAVYCATHRHLVCALDESIEGKRKAEALAIQHNCKIDYQIGNVLNYEYGQNHWDAIVSIWLHLPDRERVNHFKKIANALRIGGLFILEAYHLDQPRFKSGGPPTQDLLYTAIEFENYFTGFEFLHCQELERNVIEGDYHTGLSKVVQVMVKKLNSK